MAPLQGSGSVAHGVRRCVVLLIFIGLAGLGLLGNVTDLARVCTESTTHDGAEVNVCRPLAMTDPPMVFGTLAAAMLLGPDASALGRAALDLRRPGGDKGKWRR